MDFDEGRLFIGGTSRDTTEDMLRDYFSRYGEVTQAVIKREKITNRPRGYGFIQFADPFVLDKVLQDKHTINGRRVESQKAFSRKNARRSFGGAGNYGTKRIIVGELPSSLTEDEFRHYFESFGRVTSVVIMYHGRFGFISFDSEAAVSRVLHKTSHKLNNTDVVVKRAFPKAAILRGGRRGGGYQYYGSGANASTLDGRMGDNRFMQPQTTGRGYAPYFSYEAANSSIGYGSYGGHNIGSYGSADIAFGGYAGGYGNPNIPNTGYISGVPGALKSQWSIQTPEYGVSGYSANAGYGATVPWSVPGSGGAVSVPIGQSLSWASGYGRQGYTYGYGNYGGSEGSYPNSSGYGTVGGRAVGASNSNSGGNSREREQQGTGGGYMGSGYGNGNGSSSYLNVDLEVEPES